MCSHLNRLNEAILMSTHNIPKNEFETAVVNEPSVFEPFKFYCIDYCLLLNGLFWFVPA